MYDYRVEPDELQEGDVLHDLVFKLLVDHGVAAVFYDYGLARKFLYVRQRVNEYLRLFYQCFHSAVPLYK